MYKIVCFIHDYGTDIFGYLKHPTGTQIFSVDLQEDYCFSQNMTVSILHPSQ